MAWAMMAKGERYKQPVALAGVNEIAPVNRRDVKVGRRTARNAEPVDPAIRTTTSASALSNAGF